MRAAPRPWVPAARLFCAFAGMGGTASIIPASIPFAAQNANTAVAEYLGVVPALFFGLLAGVILAGFLLRSTTATSILAAGSLLQFAALLTMSMAPDGTGFAIAAGFAGVGFGLCEASGSILARVLAGQETAGLLSALTGTVATVAAVGPLLVVTGPFNSNAFQLLAVVAFGHLGTAALFIFGGARSEGDDQQATASSDSPLTRPSALVVLLAPVAGALFVYVGVETVFAGWSAVIPAGALGLNASTAALGTSAFWILMATGRYAACLILKSAVRPRTLLLAICAAASACFAVAGLFRYANPGAAVFAAGGAVLCLGPMYSLILGIGLIRVTVQDAKKAVGLLVACGAAGGSFVPATVLAVTADPSAPAVFWSAAVLTAVVATLVLIPAHVEPAAVISTSSPGPTSGEQRGM